MAGKLQPLDQKFPVVGPDGRPTLYFIQWAQQRQIDITDSITAAQALEIITQFLADHQLQAGSGITLTPSGNLTDKPIVAAEVQAILDQISTTQGTVLFRGAADWQALAPGAAGDFLKTNGAGADPEWAAGGGGGGGGMTLIQRQIVAAPSATVTFSAIPGTFNHLKLIWNARCSVAGSAEVLQARFNGDIAANYEYRQENRFGASEDFAATFAWVGRAAGAALAAAYSQQTTLDIYDYTLTSYHRTFFSESNVRDTGTSLSENMFGRWKNVATAINAIEIAPTTGGATISTGSVFSLYGY